MVLSPEIISQGDELGGQVDVAIAEIINEQFQPQLGTFRNETETRMEFMNLIKNGK